MTKKSNSPLAKYRGKWVAFEPGTDRVVASGATVTEANYEAKKQGWQNAVLYPVPKNEGFFVGLTAP